MKKRVLAGLLIVLVMFSTLGISANAASYLKPSNGTYNFTTALKSNMVLDVSGNNTENGTNIQIYENNKTTAQQFTITHVKDGWYKLIKYGTNKAVDVAGGVNRSGVNVQLYDWNGSNAQLWRFYDAQGGYYYLKNKLGYYLDVSGGSTANETNVQVWEGNGTNAQRWKLAVTTSIYDPYVYISNGLYVFTTALKSNMVMDVSGAGTSNGTNIQIYESNNTVAQKFNVVHVSNGWYKILNIKSGKAVDVKGGEKNRGVNVQLYDWNGTDAQLWRFYDAGNGYFCILNKLGFYLDVSGGGKTNGTNVQVWDKNSTYAQCWKLTLKEIVSYDEIVSAASRYGLSSGSNPYKALQSINTKYYESLKNDKNKTLVFFFEGVGNNSSPSKRLNAMSVVVKNGKIKFINRNSSTIPDYPFNPSKNDGTPMPTTKSGIYNFSTVNHKSSYAALNVNNALVVRHKSKTNYYNSSSAGINVHRRSSNNIAPNNENWVNSAGCLLVGEKPDRSSKTSEYAKFIQAVGIVNSNGTASSKYQTYITGKVIIDREFAEQYLKNIGYTDGAIKAIGK